MQTGDWPVADKRGSCHCGGYRHKHPQIHPENSCRDTCRYIDIHLPARRIRSTGTQLVDCAGTFLPELPDAGTVSLPLYIRLRPPTVNSTSSSAILVEFPHFLHWAVILSISSPFTVPHRASASRLPDCSSHCRIRRPSRSRSARLQQKTPDQGKNQLDMSGIIAIDRST